MSELTCDLLLVGIIVVASCREATNLFEVVFNKVFEPLDTVGLALWKRKTSVSNCLLLDSVNEVVSLAKAY